MIRVLKPLIEALFRLLFTYDCLGEENVPATGPAVVASNHPSYLYPVLLSLQVSRPQASGCRGIRWGSAECEYGDGRPMRFQPTRA